MKDCLIVDDSKTVRRIVSHIMQGFQFQCREAENGELAQQECQKGMPDLIMLDWNMPVMNGIDFIQVLRTMENGTAPRVIFCTTESDNSFIERALMAGCDEYIMKPFNREIVGLKLVQLGILEEAAL